MLFTCQTSSYTEAYRNSFLYTIGNTSMGYLRAELSKYQQYAMPDAVPLVNLTCFISRIPFLALPAGQVRLPSSVCGLPGPRRGRWCRLCKSRAPSAGTVQHSVYILSHQLAGLAKQLSQAFGHDFTWQCRVCRLKVNEKCTETDMETTNGCLSRIARLLIIKKLLWLASDLLWFPDIR
jgi:hypothetical protein